MKRRARTMGIVAVIVSVAIIAWMLLRADPRHDWAEFPSPDPWYRPPTNVFIQSGGAKERDPATFAVVVAKEAEALARLERSSYVEVSEQEAADLAGRPLGGVGGKLVLLRALRGGGAGNSTSLTRPT